MPIMDSPVIVVVAANNYNFAFWKIEKMHEVKSMLGVGDNARVLHSKSQFYYTANATIYQQWRRVFKRHNYHLQPPKDTNDLRKICQIVQLTLSFTTPQPSWSHHISWHHPNRRQWPNATACQTLGAGVKAHKKRVMLFLMYLTASHGSHTRGSQ